MVFLSARKGAHIAVSQGPVRVPLPAITFYFFFFRWRHMAVAGEWAINLVLL